MNASFLLSGDHCGGYLKPGPSEVTLRSATPPSAARSVSSYSPLRSLQYAIVLPSGDQRGYRSAMPDERVTLIVAPRSAGTVTMSPRASNTARRPVGDTDAAVINWSALTVRARSVDASVTTRIETSETFSPGRLSKNSLPPAWKTMASGPIEGNVMSKSSNCVTWRTAPVPRSSAQMLLRWLDPRSDRK